MSLVIPLDSLPKPKPGWEIWGRTKNNELVALGEFAKLSIGQRILGTYAHFYHVDMTPQEVSFDSDVRSGIGELHFKVRFDVTCAVTKTRVSELLPVADPIAQFVKKALTDEAHSMAEKHDAMQDRAFQKELTEIVDPKRGGSLDCGPFHIQRAVIKVQLPEELKAESEIEAVMTGLPSKILLAQSRGEDGLVERLEKTLARFQKFQLIQNDVTLDTAKQAAEMTKLIQEAEREDDPDLVHIGLLKKARQNMITSPEMSGPGATAAGSAGVNELPKPSDDPDDLN
ncbi:hypothetical protein [Ruegeria halocynthiae]|uniref:hypothetical protein n=1 Tax=Ruegeria halocynthiae TaxID=985054 RepID=UPI00056B547A|nr:hypothetical protein [Ruegeria halocynthiae]